MGPLPVDVEPLMGAQACPDGTTGATPYVDLRSFLASLQAHAHATGLRNAALEVGLSPSGLQKRSTPERPRDRSPLR